MPASPAIWPRSCFQRCPKPQALDRQSSGKAASCVRYVLGLLRKGKIEARGHSATVQRASFFAPSIGQYRASSPGKHGAYSALGDV
jgi:hypothetical protein